MLKRIVLSVCAAVAAAVSAWGDIYTWTGGTGAWDDETHWQVNGVTATQAPGEGDDVLLPAPEDATGNYTVTATGAISVHNFTIGAEDDSHLGTVTFVSDTVATHQIDGDLVVKDKGTMTHTAFSYDNKVWTRRKLNLSVTGKVSIEAGGLLDAKGKGYPSDKGPTSVNMSTGGAYGGFGYKAETCYGSVREPIDGGSGGFRWNYVAAYGGAGGGAIHLTVEGALTVVGTIRADGDDGSGGSSGGGAGGSIWLDAASVTGLGSISAVAGRASGTSYYGGGGRVAIYQREASELAFPRERIEASNGTIYLQNQDDVEGRGELLLRGASGSRSLFAAKLADTEGEPDGSRPFGKITYEGTTASELRVVDGIIVSVFGDVLLGKAKLTTANGGGIDLCPAAFCAVSGTFEVDTLICTNADATVEFASGTSLTVADNGTMWLQGSEGHPLTLLSAEPAWSLSVNAGVDAQVKYVAASNSVVLTGMVTDTEGTDLGGNEGWTFPKETPEGTKIFWTGAAGTEDWGTAGNWIDEFDQVRAPKTIDAIVIKTGCDPYPTLAMSTEAYSLTVDAGAALRIVNATLSVTHDVTLAADALTMDVTSTFVLAGTETQIADCGGNAFRHLVVAGPDVTFRNGFSAYSFVCEQEGDVALRFSAGDAYEMSSVRVIAADGKTVSLDSTAGDSSWYLKANVGAIFTGVSVKDSDASKGATIATVDYDNRGNNVNWSKGANIWKGTTNAKWETASNWLTGEVPTNTTDVIIPPTAVAPTLAKATTVRSLAVGDGTAAAKLTIDAPLTVCTSFGIYDGCTVTANKPIVISNDFTLARNAILTHTSADAEKRIDITALGDIRLAAGSKIDVTNLGFGSGKGTGYEACYGGIFNSQSGKCYGAVRRPVSLGSGGSHQNQYGWVAGAGGGAAHLKAVGTMMVDADIEALGDKGLKYGKTGSGGSVWLEAAQIVGSGLITASSGGGGRISLVQTTATELAIPMDRLDAGFGTIYIENANDAEDRGTLYLKGAGTSELSSQVTDATVPFGSIVFLGTSASTKLNILNDVVVGVYGDIDTASGSITATAGTTGGLDLCASNGTQHVAGAITVGTLVATNGVEEIEFAAGKAITVYDNGTLWMEGRANRKIKLTSSAPGTQWMIAAGENLAGQMRYLDVHDSKATDQPIKAKGSIGKKANNDNWTFPNGFALIVN